MGVQVEVAKQAHLGQMVDQLAVDVEHQRCQRTPGVRSLRLPARAGEAGFAERLADLLPRLHTA